MRLRVLLFLQSIKQSPYINLRLSKSNSAQTHHFEDSAIHASAEYAVDEFVFQCTQAKFDVIYNNATVQSGIMKRAEQIL